MPSKPSRVRSFLLVLAAVCLALSATSVAQRMDPPGRDPGSPRPHGPQPSATLSICGQTCGTTFHIDQVHALTAIVNWRNAAGKHTQQIKFLLPKGETYQIMETKFEGNGPQTSVLPVAGTWIQAKELTGKWTVQVYLDGQLVTQSGFIVQRN